MDIDEEAFREGVVTARLWLYENTFRTKLIQTTKSGGGPGSEEKH